MARWNFMITAAALAAGCATLPETGSAPTPATPRAIDVNSANRVSYASPSVQGLTVPPPEAHGWAIVNQNSDRVGFAKPGDYIDHQWAAWVIAVATERPMDGYFPLAQFAARVELVAERDHFTLVERQLQAVDRAGASWGARCLRRTSRLIAPAAVVAARGDSAQSGDSDQGARSAGHQAQTVDFFCNHPHHIRRVLWIRVSESTPIRGDRDDYRRDERRDGSREIGPHRPNIDLLRIADQFLGGVQIVAHTVTGH